MSDSNPPRERLEQTPAHELEWLATEIAGYIARTSTPAVREATARGFRATPDEMGRAAVAAAAQLNGPMDGHDTPAQN